MLKNIFKKINMSVITNQKLSLKAKGIYCYLAVYSNRDNVAFPSRDRIIRELTISIGAYYKHFRQLEKSELVSIQRRPKCINRYLINNTATNKYGTAYKSIMTNPEISIEAKVLYVYLTCMCYYDKTRRLTKAQIKSDLGLSAYKLKRYLNELAKLNIIYVEFDKVSVAIRNTFHKKNADSVQQDNYIMEENATYAKEANYDGNMYESRSEEQLFSAVSSSVEDTPVETEKASPTPLLSPTNTKTDFYLKKAYERTVKKKKYKVLLSILLNSNALSLSDFFRKFTERFERNTTGITIRNPIAYMSVMLQEYISYYDVLKTETTYRKPKESYGATYDIAAYESTSVIDEAW